MKLHMTVVKKITTSRKERKYSTPDGEQVEVFTVTQIVLEALDIGSGTIAELRDLMDAQNGLQGEFGLQLELLERP